MKQSKRYKIKYIVLLPHQKMIFNAKILDCQILASNEENAIKSFKFNSSGLEKILEIKEIK